MTNPSAQSAPIQRQPSLDEDPANATIWWLTPRTARLLTPLLFLLCLESWLVGGRGFYGHQHQPILLLLALVAGLIPPLRNTFDCFWRKMQRPTLPTNLAIAFFLGAASSLYLYQTLRYEKIPFRPTFQDEFSYLIQMHMLARGRLWMPPIPCPPFFDTFYVLVKPVYASMYFPGAAMMFVPVLWLHLPYFIAPLAVAGLGVAALYLVISEVLDGVSGFLAVLLLLALGEFRLFSIMVMANIPAMLLGLIMTFAVLCWRRRMRPGWLVLLGAASGWAAITRPADALCFAIVLAVVIALDLRHKPLRSWCKTAAIVFLAASPFFSIQLAFNRAVTGRWLQTPFAYYSDLNYPGAFGFHHGPMVQHVSDIPEKRVFYELYARPTIEQHQLKHLFDTTLLGELDQLRIRTISDPFLWLLFPLALPALWNRRFWAVWGILPVFLIVLAGYSFSTIFPHYTITVMPAVIFLLLLPIRFLTDAFPAHKSMIRTTLAFAITALALVSMPQSDWVIHDQYFRALELERIDRTVSQNVAPPAVILFHFNLHTASDGRLISDDPNQEPVFNSDVAWPDDAPIIRARDVNASPSSVAKAGDKNLPLYQYYLRHDPRRVFYLYDRAGGSGNPVRLGTAAQLVRAATTPPS